MASQRRTRSQPRQRRSKSTALQVRQTTDKDKDRDRALVDAVIEHVSRIYHRGAIVTVVEVGEHLIETLFGGDLELARSHHPAKPAAMGQLLARARETPLSAHILKKSVPIAVQYRALPPTVADRLPQSHHELLLLVKDPAKKTRLAHDAVTRKLSVKQFDREIRRESRKHAGGRTPQPAVVRWATGVRRATRSPLDSATLSAAALQALQPHEALTVEQALNEAREEIERVADALHLHRRPRR